MLCSKCNVEIAENKILHHLRNYHEGETDLNISCPRCGKLFQTISMYQKHWYGFHHESKKKKAGGSQHEEEPSSKRQCSAESSPTPPGSPSAVSAAVIDTTPQSSSSPTSPGSSSAVSAAADSTPQSSSSAVCATKSFPAPESSCSEVCAVIEVSNFKVCETSGNMSSIGGGYDGSQDSASESDSNDDSNDSDSESGEELENIKCLPSYVQNVVLCSGVASQSEVSENSGNFVLKLRENCNSTFKAVSDTLKDAEGLVRNALESFAEEINEKLKTKNVSLNDVMNVDAAIDQKSNLFSNLKTDEQQKKYFTEKLNLVLPERIPLGSEFRRVRRKGRASVKTIKKQEEFMFVPVDKLSGKLVNQPDYKDFVENGSFGTSSHFLDSYMKGRQSKINPVLREHPDALRFVLYYDDLEVCCPLKSKSGVQKIGAFYLFIDNIPYKYRSNLNLICLVALANANFLKKESYGIDVALQHIVNYLKRFEDGVVINGQKTFGTLIAFIGDNLGVHAAAGFKEGFTAHHGCRFCSCHFDKIQELFRENPSLLRDKQTHDRQCSQVQTARGKNEVLSKKYGVNNASALNQLRSFHVVGGTPPDACHDILEGSLPLTIKKFLKHCLYDVPEKDRKFTLDWVNKAIRDFDFDYAEKADRPSALKKDYILSEDTTLHQSACQTWLLATILPLIVGPYMDIDDKYYFNFLECLEICRIVFSFDVSEHMVLYLGDIIESYLRSFKSLYGHLIPKQHHLIHYPSVILDMGSLMNYQCLRCEAKHRFFKKLVNVIGCYKNIPYSLALRHQFCQGAAWAKGLKKPNKCGPCKVLSVKETAYCSLLPVQTGTIMETNWLFFEGNKFVPDHCFICVGVEDFLPIFAKVMKVVIHPNYVVFVCQKVKTLRRSVHLAAFSIQVLDEMCVFKPQDMRMHSVFHAHKVKGSLYIAVKYCAQGTIF